MSKCPGGCQLIDITMVPGGYYCTACGEAIPKHAVMVHANVPEVRPPSQVSQMVGEDESILPDGSKLEMYCVHCPGHNDLDQCRLLNCSTYGGKTDADLLDT